MTSLDVIAYPTPASERLLAPRMLIDGELVEVGLSEMVLNPATEKPCGFMPIATRMDLDHAVEAARTAYVKGKSLTLAERQGIVANIAALLLDNVGELALLLTQEQGKPIAEAKMEVERSARWCEQVSKQKPPSRQIDDAGRDVRYVYEPIGVVGAIAPWNFPLMLAMWKVAPALVMGNSVILKPSPFTPLTVLKVGALLRTVVPPGLLNIITGNNELGPWMTEHPGIDKISFTGSTTTGRHVMAGAATTLKRLTLELGGNDPAIVFPDVDLDDVVPRLFWAAFRNSGQVCIASKRIYVHYAIYDEVLRRLAEMARTVRVGPGDDPAVQLGPIQNRMQFDRLNSLARGAREMGLKLVPEHGDEERDGYFFAPLIVDNPPDDAPVVTEEAFGPLVPLLRFHDQAEVVARANATPFGLAASVWSRDETIAQAVAAELDCGTVWINEVHALSPERPFGGRKQSGLGAEGGVEGLLEYANRKVIVGPLRA